MRWIISIIRLWVEHVQIYKNKILLKSMTALKDDYPPQMFTVQFYTSHQQNMFHIPFIWPENKSKSLLLRY